MRNALKRYKSLIKEHNIFELVVFYCTHVLINLKIKGLYYRFKLKAKCAIYSIEVDSVGTILGNILFLKRPSSIIKIGRNFNSVNNYQMSGFNYVPYTRFKTFSSNSRIIIGSNVHINSSSLLCNSTSIELGNDVLIAPNCILTDSDFHGISPDQRRIRNAKNDRPIIIENNVWIGMNSVVLKGVRIGENSIIGAGSVVTSNVSPNSMYAGSPAKYVKKIIS
jgi:acetyltransferase-like isoleucine patch superfamily enzyme